MNRCLNGIFLYCSGKSEPTHESSGHHIVGYNPDGVAIYDVSHRCKQDPKTCPHIKNQSQLATVQQPPQQTPRQEHQQTRRMARRKTSQLVNKVIETLD